MENLENNIQRLSFDTRSLTDGDYQIQPEDRERMYSRNYWLNVNKNRVFILTDASFPTMQNYILEVIPSTDIIVLRLTGYKFASSPIEEKIPCFLGTLQSDNKFSGWRSIYTHTSR